MFWRKNLRCITAARRRPAFAGPVGVEKLAARLVNALVGVRAKIIALRLQQIRWQVRTAVAVEKGQRGAERRNRDAAFDGGGNSRAPAFLAAFDFAAKIIVQQQVRELRIVVVGFLDFAEKARADDAAAAPHQRDAAVV